MQTREGYILPEPFPVGAAFVQQTCSLSTVFCDSPGDGKVLLQQDNASVCVTWPGIIFLVLTLCSTGATQSCPLEISPEQMLIEYQGESQDATCKPTPDGLTNQEGAISWQVQQGIKTNSTSWSADTNNDWDARPVCMGTFTGQGTCQKHLDFTLYSMYCDLNYFTHFYCH